MNLVNIKNNINNLMMILSTKNSNFNHIKYRAKNMSILETSRLTKVYNKKVKAVNNLNLE